MNASNTNEELRPHVKTYLILSVILYISAFIIALIFQDNNHPTRWVTQLDEAGLSIKYAVHTYYGLAAFSFTALVLMIYNRFLRKSSKGKMEVPVANDKKEAKENSEGCASHRLISAFSFIVLLICFIIFSIRINYGVTINADEASFGKGMFTKITLAKEELQKVEIDIIYSHRGNKEYYRFITHDGEEHEVFLKSWRHFKSVNSYIEETWNMPVDILFEDKE